MIKRIVITIISTIVILILLVILKLALTPLCCNGNFEVTGCLNTQSVVNVIEACYSDQEIKMEIKRVDYDTDSLEGIDIVVVSGEDSEVFEVRGDEIPLQNETREYSFKTQHNNSNAEIQLASVIISEGEMISCDYDYQRYRISKEC